MELQLIIDRLENLGYTYDESKDKAILESFVIPKVENHIKNETNQTKVPKELKYVAIDMVCGEFLFAKKNSGQFGIADAKVENDLKRLTEGDVTYEYAITEGQSSDTKLDALINYLINGHDDELITFRKLRW